MHSNKQFLYSHTRPLISCQVLRINKFFRISGGYFKILKILFSVANHKQRLNIKNTKCRCTETAVSKDADGTRDYHYILKKKRYFRYSSWERNEQKLILILVLTRLPFAFERDKNIDNRVSIFQMQNLLLPSMSKLNDKSSFFLKLDKTNKCTASGEYQTAGYV